MNKDAVREAAEFMSTIPLSYQVCTIHITPELAARWLKRNEKNRPLSGVLVARYQRQMPGWKINGESIVFGSNGVLIDGQNRLEACARSSSGFTSVVVFGVEPDSFDTIDSGKSRTGADVLSILGETNTNILSAVLTWIWRYQNNCIGHNTKGPTSHERSRVLEQYPQIRDSMHFCRQNRGPLTPSICGLLHFLGSIHDREATEGFLTMVENGENIGKGDAAFALRGQLLGKYGRIVIKNRVVVAAIGIKALSAHLAGQEVKLLRWGRDEEFPSL